MATGTNVATLTPHPNATLPPDYSPLMELAFWEGTEAARCLVGEGGWDLAYQAFATSRTGRTGDVPYERGFAAYMAATLEDHALRR